MTSSIVKMSEARKALTEAKSLDDIMQIRDIAEAARSYARVAQLGLESQNEAAEIKIRAERKAGELLMEMPKARGGQPYQSTGNTVLPVDKVPTLAEIGIEKMQAHRWQTIATLPEEEFEEFIAETMGADKELTSAGIYRESKKSSAKDKPQAPPIPDGKYGVIYADPPWAYDNSGFDQSAASHYPTMTIDEICELPVADLAGDLCVLFLWATSPLLPSAFKVMDEWGFEYKASRVWVKDKAPGLGWWIRTRHELLLIGTRGGNYHPENKIDSIIYADVGKHSKKPDSVYDDIELAYATKKIELFARNSRDGWDSWGNEV